ncbi:MAG: cysteine hydrolase [Methylobacterium mesophilicum]|nr:cysteine hydrolase [Methylobacterium mesophilicum]
MQRMFAEETEWHAPALAGIVPNVVRIARVLPDRTLFARMSVPANAGAARGRWRDYYRRWSSMTGDRMDAGLVEVVAELAGFAAPDRTFDKPTYSLFGNPRFADRLAAMEADTLVFTGVETDVCVLATVFDAIERGYHAIVVSDAVTSASLASHEAVLTLLLPRLPEQATVTDTAGLLASLGERG